MVSTISFSGLERMDYSFLGNNVLKDHSQPLEGKVPRTVQWPSISMISLPNLNPDAQNRQNLWRSKLAENLGSFKELAPGIEGATKAILAVVAMAYVMGLVVSNLYLIKIGVTDFSLLKVKCVFTGVASLILLIVSILPGYVAIATIRILLNRRKGWKECIGGIFLFLLAEFFALLITGLVYATLISPVGERSAAAIPNSPRSPNVSTNFR